MHISLDAELRPTIDGFPFDRAVEVSELYERLGPADRISEPAKRAPVGHRNNQMHMYDRVGVYFYEHHYTRRITACDAVFDLQSRQARDLTNIFNGRLELADVALSRETDLKLFFATCPIKFTPFLAGWVTAKHGDFDLVVSIEGEGVRLGGRGKKLRLVSVEFSWPHDPWQPPSTKF